MPENPATDKLQVLQVLDRLKMKLQEKGDTSQNEKLCLFYETLKSPLFNQILTLQQSIKQLKGQLSHIPSDCSANFDFSRKGLLVFTDGAITNGNAHRSSNNLTVSGLFSWPPKSGNEDFNSVVQQMAQGRQIEYIDIERPSTGGLGFSVVALRGQNLGEVNIFVKEVQPGSIVGRDQRLRENDQILAINHTPLDQNISHQQAIALLQETTGSLCLVVAREPVHTKSSISTSLPDANLPDTIRWGHIEDVELINDGSGLGFGIVGGKSSGVVVRTIVPGGLADRDGRLKTGDHILKIGGTNVQGMTSEQVAQVLRNCGNSVRMLVARDPVGDISITPPTPAALPVALPAVASRSPSSDSSTLFETYDVELIKKDGQSLGIRIVGYVGTSQTGEASGIYVKSIIPGSAAYHNGQIQVNDQIVAVDGVNIQGFANQDVVEVLRNAGQVVHLTLVRRKTSLSASLCEGPSDRGTVVEPPKTPALFLTGAVETETNLEEKTEERMEDLKNDNTQALEKLEKAPDSPENELKSRWENVLGPDYEVMVATLDTQIADDAELQKYSKLLPIHTLRLGMEVDSFDGHHYISSIAPGGPLDTLNLLQPEDELLEVNGVQLYGKSRREAVSFLKEVPPPFTLVCCRRLFDDEASVDEPRTTEVSPPEVKDPLDPTRSVIVIRSLVPNGVAERGGELLPGDRLVSVNQYCLDNVTLAEAVEVLKAVPPGTVRLGICKPLVEGDKEEESSILLSSNNEDKTEISGTIHDINSSLILEAPQGFRDEPYFKEELVDEPFLDLGKAFQSQQKEIDNSKEAWEMHEFMVPRLQEMGEEREMLVDEEYELYQDQLQSLESYPSSHIQEAAPVPSMEEVHFGTQWFPDCELPEPQEAGHMMSMYPQDMQQCGCSPEEMMKENFGIDSLSIPSTEGNAQQGRFDDLENLNSLTKSSLDLGMMIPNDVQGPGLLVELPVVAQRREQDDLPLYQFSRTQAVSKVSAYAGMLSSRYTTDACELPEREEGEGEETPNFSHWGPPRIVEIFREPDVSLGISIVGGQTVIKRLKNGEELKGIFIKQVLEDSPAGKTNALKTGDKILEVSGVDLQNASHREAVEAIKNAGNPVVFVVQSLSSTPRVIPTVHNKAKKVTNNQDQDTQEKKEKRRGTAPPPMKLPPPYRAPSDDSDESEEECAFTNMNIKGNWVVNFYLQSILVLLFGMETKFNKSTAVPWFSTSLKAQHIMDTIDACVHLNRNSMIWVGLVGFPRSSSRDTYRVGILGGREQDFYFFVQPLIPYPQFLIPHTWEHPIIYISRMPPIILSKSSDPQGEELQSPQSPALFTFDPRIPPGSFVRGILQARILEWVAISFSIKNYPTLLPVALVPVALLIRNTISSRKSEIPREHFISITTNKASGVDEIPVELFQILKYDTVKKGNDKECSNYHTIALISHASKVILKILQVRLQQNLLPLYMFVKMYVCVCVYTKRSLLLYFSLVGIRSVYYVKLIHPIKMYKWLISTLKGAQHHEFIREMQIKPLHIDCSGFS
ncbi:hypothetical protein FD754_007577 [Muntiacus muntjak]|uniref:InaD-like protein n=1 Tax=Muntiacus muntjak TaxID=9888 RepID=A0A5N3WP12_MUNMU|nr:hypothetical protein FD754_007577 [Muntiacus muntjak]